MVSAQIRSEALKVASVRSLAALPAIAMLVAPAVALLVALTESLAPDDTVLGGALTGSALGMALIGAWGALLVTSEYSAGTMRAVLAANPRRGEVLGAKTLLACAVATAVGFGSSSAALAIGNVLLDSSKYAAGDPFPALLGITLCYPAVACLGLAVGTVLRSSAGAVAVMLLLAILPGVVGPLLGGLGPWVTGAGPSAVVAKLAQSSDATAAAMGSLGGWASLAVLFGYAAVALAGADRSFEKRDA